MKKLFIGAVIALVSTSSFGAGKWSEMGKVEASYVDMRTTTGRILVKQLVMTHAPIMAITII
jgi:hypothetical protein